MGYLSHKLTQYVGPVGGTFDYGTNKYVGFQLLGGAIWVSGSQLRMQDCQVVRVGWIHATFTRKAVRSEEEGRKHEEHLWKIL